jgi:hypothetical protein
MRYSSTRHSSSGDDDVAQGLRSREGGYVTSRAQISTRRSDRPREMPRNVFHFVVRAMKKRYEANLRIG